MSELIDTASAAKSRVKRCIDVSVALMTLTFAIPVLLSAALLIRVSSSGPVLFRQPRQGLDGSVFNIWKFRTMHVDAELRRGELAFANESDGPLFKILEDPRLTWAGRILRRWSIDEVPQLFNVLAGDMSLVGPRPLPTQDIGTVDALLDRLSVKPGMTGPWQVSGRSTLGWEEMIRLDSEYVRSWSVCRDLQILARTPAAVIRGHGAY